VRIDALNSSVALCTYNGAKYLVPQLESLAAQTRLPCELVVADDGSTDDTILLIENFARNSPFPVRLSKNERNLGYRANFMRAAQRTHGDVIFFCDQDDTWDKDKIEVVCREFETDGALLVYHNAAVVDSEGREVSTLYSGPEQLSAIGQKPMSPKLYSLGFTQAFRRDLMAFDDLWPSSLDHMTDQVMAHDQWYFFLAACFGGVRFVDERLVRHRQHESNVYGVADAGSRWRRFASRFSHQPEWDRLEAQAASRRALILTKLCERRPEFAARGSALVRSYEDTAERHRRRHRAYTAPALGVRLAAFMEASVKGDYQGRPWGLDPRALPRDFLKGVLNGSATRAGE
jgi:glycosyltransferase involved in cell wall biosynthesis